MSSEIFVIQTVQRVHCLKIKYSAVESKLTCVICSINASTIISVGVDVKKSEAYNVDVSYSVDWFNEKNWSSAIGSFFVTLCPTGVSEEVLHSQSVSLAVRPLERPRTSYIWNFVSVQFFLD